jgi:hypothetical protein
VLPVGVLETGVEAAEVGQRRRRRGQPQHRALVDLPLGRAHVGQLGLQLAGDGDQHLDQVRHRAAGGADRGHEQHGVPRGLVDLDAVAVHQVAALEVVALDAGGADVDGDPGRVEDELVVLPGPDHVRQAGAQRLVNA